MIQPHFDYCNVIWMHPNSQSLKRLQILQNRALRTVLQVDFYYNRIELFKRAKVDCLNVKIKKDLATLIFKLLNHLAPDLICSRLCTKTSSYSLRNIERTLVLDKPNTNIFKLSTLYNASHIFNELPQLVRNEVNFSCFIRGISELFPMAF